jgi:hypothetical protein
LKSLYRKLQKLKHSSSKNADKKAAKELEIKQIYQDYIDLAGFYLEHVQASLRVLKNGYKIEDLLLAGLHTLTGMPNVKSTKLDTAYFKAKLHVFRRIFLKTNFFVQALITY